MIKKTPEKKSVIKKNAEKKSLPEKKAKRDIKPLAIQKQRLLTAEGWKRMRQRERQAGKTK